MSSHTQHVSELEEEAKAQLARLSETSASLTNASNQTQNKLLSTIHYQSVCFFSSIAADEKFISFHIYSYCHI